MGIVRPRCKFSGSNGRGSQPRAPSLDVRRHRHFGHVGSLRPKPFYSPATQSSGFVLLAASGAKVFGGIKVPARTRRLYIMDMGCLNIVGGAGGAAKVQPERHHGRGAHRRRDGRRVWLTVESSRQTCTLEASSHVYATGLPTAGDVIHFRIVERSGATVNGSAFVIYAAFGI